MGKNRKWIQLVILGAILLIGGWTIGTSLTERSDQIPQNGDKAPEFSVKGLDGSALKLSDLKGKPVVLNFWGTFCLPCRDEMPALQRAADKWASSGVTVLGMNLGENAVSVKSFVEQYKVRFPVYLDKDETIRKRYGVMSYPSTFFIRPDGTIFEKKIGEMDDAYIEQTLTALLASR
ncbi:peroxiredoxin family protein [Gorillibacterium sp. sgz5001074]|uniref:peroxiredoxin family protein n=1 Tax=Gorillibacterium sp. sgz5001074 TaxID=3446695 RepID=UPI003F67A721